MFSLGIMFAEVIARKTPGVDGFLERHPRSLFAVDGEELMWVPFLASNSYHLTEPISTVLPGGGGRVCAWVVARLGQCPCLPSNTP